MEDMLDVKWRFRDEGADSVFPKIGPEIIGGIIPSTITTVFKILSQPFNAGIVS